MRALREAGHDVVAIAPTDGFSAKIAEEGFVHRHFPLDPAGTNPLCELGSVLALRRLLRDERIDMVLSFTPKGNIYSGLVLHRHMRFIANVSGLGRAFANGSRLEWLMGFLFRRALGRACAVLFQNGDDMQLLVANRIVGESTAFRIPGSGVDLQKFVPRDEKPDRTEPGLVFLLFARLLRAKGVGYYAEAARRIKARHPDMVFRVLGPLEPSSAGVPERALRSWEQEGIIEYVGVANDVRPHLANTDCVVLPTYYREGVPRSLLEAAAMSKPLVTTDVAGSRDAVEDGITGFLCRAQDTDSLVASLEKFIALPPAERLEMGQRGRAKMEAEFDEKFVIDRYLDLVSKTVP